MPNFASSDKGYSSPLASTNLMSLNFGYHIEQEVLDTDLFEVYESLKTLQPYKPDIRLEKPRILVCGRIGSGKSSLIKLTPGTTRACFMFQHRSIL